MHLLDTDILIDYLRQYAEATIFVDGLREGERSIAVLSQFELLKGCRKKVHEEHVNMFLKQWKIYQIHDDITKKALAIYRIYRWQTGLGIFDSFIAATAILHQKILLTKNIKHYQDIAGLKVERPYD